MRSNVPSSAFSSSFVFRSFHFTITSSDIVSAARRSPFIGIEFCRRRVSRPREHDVIHDVRIVFVERLRRERVNVVLHVQTIKVLTKKSYNKLI